MDDVLAFLDAGRDRFLAELVEFLRIPSISSAEAYRDDVRRSAELGAIGRVPPASDRLHARRSAARARPPRGVRGVAGRAGRAHGAGLRPLRRAARRPARALAVTAVRARAARRAPLRPRRA